LLPVSKQRGAHVHPRQKYLLPMVEHAAWQMLKCSTLCMPQHAMLPAAISPCYPQPSGPLCRVPEGVE
jgi:hypothetical protein